jgi:hypothetical protein
MALQNLNKLEASVSSAIEPYCRKLISELGPALKAISVYGSATGPDYVAGKSNINLVVLVEKLDRGVLAGLLDIAKSGKKARIVPPLLLTPAYIVSSLDVFPIEFMEIKGSQLLLYGDDHFSSLEVRPEHLRLECESQLKAAVLRTRQAYLEIGSMRKGAEAVLHASMTSLVPVLRAMLRLRGVEAPRRKLDVVKAVGDAFGIDTAPFIAVLHDKAGDEKIGGREAHDVLASYVDDLEALAARVDQL